MPPRSRWNHCTAKSIRARGCLGPRLRRHARASAACHHPITRHNRALYHTGDVRPHPSISDPGASPGLAFLLGFIPGVGAIYNGQYVKGLIHVVVMGVLIAIVSNDELSGNLQPLFGMMIAVWVFYMAFEAYHTAKRRQLGQPVDEFSSIVPRAGQRFRFPLAPTVLIAVGVLFLLHNLNILRIGQIIRYWPMALIAWECICFTNGWRDLP